MKTILVPVNFSEASDKALDFALEMVKHTKAKIIVSHSLYVPLPTFAVPSELRNAIYQEEEKVATAKLEDLEKKLQSAISVHETSVEYDIIHTTGVAQMDIPSIAKDKKADLILMGTHAPDDVMGFVGSTTVDIINQLPCPVLVVHKDTHLKNLKNVTIALQDVKKEIFSLTKVVEIFKAFSPTFTVLHVQCGEVENAINLHDRETEICILIKAIKDYTSYQKVKYKLIHAENEIDGFKVFTEQHPVNLMVLLKQNRSWVNNIFHQSFTKHLLKNTTLPILILPN